MSFSSFYRRFLEAVDMLEEPRLTAFVNWRSSDIEKLARQVYDQKMAARQKSESAWERAMDDLPLEIDLPESLAPPRHVYLTPAVLDRMSPERREQWDGNAIPALLDRYPSSAKNWSGPLRVVGPYRAGNSLYEVLVQNEKGSQQAIPAAHLQTTPTRAPKAKEKQGPIRQSSMKAIANFRPSGISDAKDLPDEFLVWSSPNTKSRSISLHHHKKTPVEFTRRDGTQVTRYNVDRLDRVAYTNTFNRRRFLIVEAPQLEERIATMLGDPGKPNELRAIGAILADLLLEKYPTSGIGIDGETGMLCGLEITEGELKGPGFDQKGVTKWFTAGKIQEIGEALARFCCALADRDDLYDLPVLYTSPSSYYFYPLKRAGVRVQYDGRGKLIVNVDEKAPDRTEAITRKVKVGDIFDASSPVNANYSRFYQVVKVSSTGKSADLRAVAAKAAPGEDTGSGSYRIVPDLGNFLSGDPGRLHRNRRIRYVDGRPHSVKIPNESYVSFWDGRPISYQTHYYWD